MLSHFKYKYTYRSNVNGRRKIHHANNNRKKAGIAILISDSANIKVRKVIRDKEGYYIMIKGSILQEYITILNGYLPNNSVSGYMS